MTPLDVVQRWFDAWERGDLDAARALLAPGAPVAVFGQRSASLQGFDEFLAWYGERRAHVSDFSYRVDELLSGEQHVAALITLRQGGREFRQVALYRVDGNAITEMEAYEEPR